MLFALDSRGVITGRVRVNGATVEDSEAVVITLALNGCVVMAFSRLYLGVHFASDVVAGTFAGAAWVAICASAFEVIRSRRTISAPEVRLHQQRKHGV